jgi:hypothetical protein
MLAAPLAVGVALGGPRPAQALLAAAALAAYLAFQAGAGWLAASARARPRYALPAAAYGGSALAAGGALALAAPAMLPYAGCAAGFAAVGLACAALRFPRAIVGDAATMAAACLLAPCAAALGARPGIQPWELGAPAAAWCAGAALFAYFFGTAFYVKTMIRERGSGRWYAASVAYHVALAAGAAWWAGPWGAALGGALALRAALAPRLWPRARPRAVGLGEVAATVLVAALILSQTLP